jgi:hypothetical protein
MSLLEIYFLYILYDLWPMKNLSLKMDDKIFLETEDILSKVRKNRNRYINEAVEFYNLLQKSRILAKQFLKESKLVREESLKVLEEFEKLENEDEAV